MLKLSREAFRKAAVFIRENARPVDKALFEFEFRDGSIEFAAQELARYQNADGGFGHGIEPDMRLRASSPFATSVGIQYCIALGLDTESPIVEAAIKYLVSTYDRAHDYWVHSYEDVNNEPHAPWWHVDTLAPPIEEKWPNVSAENVGYLNRFSEHVPPDLLTQANARAKRNLESSDTIPALYDFMCWQRAHPYLPEPIKSLALRKLGRTAEAVVDSLKDTKGEIRIFWLAPHPTSPLMRFPEIVYSLFDAEITAQKDDGGWWPTWNWGQYDDVWPMAEREWAGKMTAKCLIVLKRHGLIE